MVKYIELKYESGKNIMEDISYITIPAGFKANGVASGMKCSDRANINPDTPKYTYLDVGLVASDTPCTVAGVYTDPSGA